MILERWSKLPAETVRIGRLRDCDICIAEHPTVSSVHALLFSRDGNLFIEDQKSSNGTFVNDEQVHGNVQLAVKDVIALGKTGPSLALADFSILQEPEFPSQNHRFNLFLHQ